MKNSDLMQILKQINLNAQYKAFALAFGTLALAGIIGGIYYYSKFKSANQSLEQSYIDYNFLLKDSLIDKDLVRQQQEEINRLQS